MGLEGEPEVVLVLSEHGDQLLVVACQSVCDLVKCLLHLGDVAFQFLDHGVGARTPVTKLRFDILHERFKNYHKKDERYMRLQKLLRE